ncbi:MAG: oligoendopeptidase F [Bacillota bacterium]|jgi:oligoendopeptidase F|nr:oligoendopeptidase F [Bacillota bacterium]HHT91195.1 oligoendopeptidase F [Bacillota bacterium]
MKQLQRREEIAPDLKWRLEDIYPSDQEWEQDLAKLKASKQSVLDVRGTLTSGENLLRALQIQDEIGLLADRVIAYSHMRKDEDNTNSRYQAHAAQAMAVAVELSAARSFFLPEILALDPDQVKGWIQETPGLQVYAHYLENILRLQPHTLPAEQEELLAAAGEMAQAPGNIFRMFNNADLKFPEVKNDHGEVVELTHGRYGQLLESQQREVRKGAFDALYATYASWKNTLGATFVASAKKELYFARARKYRSSLEAALYEDNVAPEVYTNLVSSIHDHLPLLHRYVRLRKKLLGLEELHMYDLYVPMVADQDMEIPRQEAVGMVQTGLHHLGAQYLSDLDKSFTDGWIDWLENRGKTSGAYSWGTYGVHPYVLLNYQETLNDVFTLAHELGHAMHTFYSDKNQEFVNAGYTIFVAEVASTLNEALLMDDLLRKTKDPKKRAYLLNHFLEQYRGTVFRQTMFAEFEMIVHGKIGEGESLTSEVLSEIYYDLNKKYYGEDIVVDEAIAMEWARIPHFYRPFYVYKYATGFSAAISLSQQILKEGEPAVQRYLEFLGGGGSDYPINLLQKAGVDMSRPEPIVQAMGLFDELLGELEQLAATEL